MKLKKLHINSFRHLESLKFDFTYPEDFYIVEKRGKPLDKICIIGQSATGKTGLLELIKHRYEYITEFEFFQEIGIKGFETKENHEAAFTFTDDYGDRYEMLLHNNSLVITENDKQKEIVAVNKLIFSPLIQIDSNIVNEKNIDFFNKSSFEIISQVPLLDLNYSYTYKIDELIWFKLLKDIIEYRKKQLDLSSHLTSEGEIFNAGISDIVNRFNKENINPLIEYAKKFNTLLKKLNLEIDVQNTNSIISFKDLLSKENIDISKTSTGTKQLLFTYLPLLKLNTKDAIILIDEPERSLYPDIQMELVDFYQKLAPEAQFVIATHSPFVAASFEPCERFILYFDEDGKVAVRRGVSPVGDDPNDIIYEDFGVNYYNKDYQEKFKHYLELLDKSKNEENKELKKKFILEASKLGNIYNFNLNEEDRKTQ